MRVAAIECDDQFFEISMICQTVTQDAQVTTRSADDEAVVAGKVGEEVIADGTKSGNEFGTVIQVQFSPGILFRHLCICPCTIPTVEHRGCHRNPFLRCFEVVNLYEGQDIVQDDARARWEIAGEQTVALLHISIVDGKHAV